ncbi:MAG TPA: efflux RND transporter periplasmic adaptor subunit [Pirellulales bacterium]|jgi:multidrug efflux system membrane fusion protein|nr:efflux RND transporter periplasmic adaptor subunit [Pirellulales bacterium]
MPLQTGWICWGLGGLFLIGLGGCTRSAPQAAPQQQTAIPVSAPVQRMVTDFVDFTGQTDAVESVNVIPRVNGYLIKAPFKEGAEVQEDELLFEIDPRPYQAQYDQAESQVFLNQARVKQAKADNARAKDLARTPGAISPQDVDRYQAAEEEAEASVKAAQASLEVYKLNLSYCRVTSPIKGQVSRKYLTVGNLVNQDQTLLTTVVSLDPMYVYFDMDELTLLRIRRAINEGKVKLPQDGALPILIGLQGENGYPYQGRINFVNNQITSGTGSIKLRGSVENPKPAGGARLLSPGMFVRVRFLIGEPYPALLVIDRALGSDQGLKYLYVVDSQNTVQYRRVTTGPLQEDGLRVIAAGLKATDRVVVGGIQQVHPKLKITPDPVTMPTLGPLPNNENPAPGATKDAAQTGAPESGLSPGPKKNRAPDEQGSTPNSKAGSVSPPANANR